MEQTQHNKTELLFLGTGAADWLEPKPSGKFRGYSSLLVDRHILIDCTHTAISKMEELGIGLDEVSDVLITHSHGDHFDKEAILKLADVRKQASKSPLILHAEKSWISSISSDNLAVNPLEVWNTVKIAGYTVLPLPANHSGDYEYETGIHYLFQNERVGWLYATDGGWMLARTWHVLKQYELDCWVVDCTIGDGYEGDDWIFDHNSLPMIRIMAETMFKQGVLKKNANIVLTHLAKTLHPDHEELVKTVTSPFIVAYDGLVHIL